MNYDSTIPGKFSSLFIAFILFICLVPARAQTSESGWETITPSQDEPLQRHENGAARVGNTLYLIGGRGERPVEIYNPKTNTWKTGATPPVSMHHFQAVPYKGKIYVMGALSGNFPDEDPVANVYVYDPQKDRWEKGPAIPENRRRGAAGAVAYQGKIYLVGGIQNGHIDGHVRWLDTFDPQTGEWKQLADAPRYRDHFQAAVVNGKLYAAGGRRTSRASGRVFELTIPEVDVYDFAADSWAPLPPSGDLPTERAGSSTIAAENKLIVLGGESGSQPEAHAEVEMYDPDSGTWTSLPSLNQGRHGTQAIVYDGKIYIAAGSETRGATEINSLEVLAFLKAIRD